MLINGVTKEWLENEYLIKNRSASDISEELGTHLHMFFYLTKKFNIKKIGVVAQNPNLQYLDKETLEYLYNEEGLSTRSIAKYYYASNSAICKRMKKFGIERRKNNGYYKEKSGKRFGKLYVIPQIPIIKNKQAYWLCQCDCGNQSLVNSGALNSKNTQSCGCARKETIKQNSINKNYYDISIKYWTSIIQGAHQRGLSFEIKVEYVWDLWIKQNGKCAISGLEISFGDKLGNKNKTVSLDRIDSSKGYIEGNVQWVHTSINRMKTNLNEDKFIELCKIITEYQNGIIKV